MIPAIFEHKALQAAAAFTELEKWPACYEELPACVEWEEL